jgi:hypothetical protein
LKKAVSIILLLVFLFNVGGYYLVFWGLRLQSDKELAQRLDANLYDQDETVEIKIPLSLPYPIYGDGFERVNGAFEHNGEFFKLIKQSYENDTLYVVCIRDHETRQLVNTMTDYVQLTDGLDDSTPTEKALHYLTQLVKDFYSQEGVCLLHEFRFAMRVMFREFPQSFNQPEIAVHAPPPRI